MVYHYFNDKAGLYYAVIENELLKVEDLIKSPPEDTMKKNSNFWMDIAPNMKNYLGLMYWMDSNKGDSDLSDENTEVRADYYEDSVRIYKKMQKNGELGKGFKPQFFLVGIMALITFPVLFPGLVRLITKMGPDSKNFKQEYSKVIKWLLHIK